MWPWFWGAIYPRFACRALARRVQPGQLSAMRPLFLFAAALQLIVPAALQAQAAPAAKAPSTPPPAGQPPAEAPKIEGIELARAGGGFLGVQTEGVTLKITFYNDKKEKVAADAVRIAARWHATKPRSTVLLPSTPETLVSPPVITRPFNYILYLVLVGADDKPIETFSVRLNGSG